MQQVELEMEENLQRHRTAGFSHSKALVVRRGAPFRVRLRMKDGPFDPGADTLRVKVMLGRTFASLFFD